MVFLGKGGTQVDVSEIKDVAVDLLVGGVVLMVSGWFLARLVSHDAEAEILIDINHVIRASVHLISSFFVDDWLVSPSSIACHHVTSRPCLSRRTRPAAHGSPWSACGSEDCRSLVPTNQYTSTG